MPRIRLAFLAATLLLIPIIAISQESPAPLSPREALKPFNHFVGEWKGTGIPNGTREQKQNGFWVEKMDWAWKFKGKDAWLTIDFYRSKNFKGGELRYLPKSNSYQLNIRTTDKKEFVFEGKLEDKRLRLERKNKDGKEKHLLTFRLLHPNRFIYNYSVLPEGRTLYKQVYQVGATREGVAFAAGTGQPECIVSGGLGTSKVSYKGQTYYVCCSGCRDEFNENPEFYINEYEKKKNKKKQ